MQARSILTETTGFLGGYRFSLNPYTGYAFGCSYCYARWFTGDSARRDAWGLWVDAKTNAAGIVARDCRAGRLHTGDSVYMSSVTDPYQPVERHLAITRSILDVLLLCRVQPRLTIQTRSPLVTRDIDLLQRFERLRVDVTISTDSDAVRRRYEPRCPPIEARWKALEALAAAGIRVGVSVSPLLPLADIDRFAHRLAGLNASIYNIQFLKPSGRHFAAGSTNQALKAAAEDGWGGEEYRRARDAIRDVLAPEHVLLEGASGYGPVE